MGDLRAFHLQEFVDDFNCRYYLESDASEDSIDYALHFPFERVYALDHRSEVVSEIKLRFEYNNRVDVFERTHESAFYEFARIVPNEYSAVVWLTSPYFYKDLEQLAKIRPAKKDVIILDNKNCVRLGDLVYISKYFGLTHEIQNALLGASGKGLVLVPIKTIMMRRAVA